MLLCIIRIMAACFNVETWFVLCHVLILTVASSDLELTGDSVPVTERSVFTLTCSRTTNDVPPLLAVRWHRNSEAIFQTVKGTVLQDASKTSQYDVITGRINVITNQQNHKLMLHINSSLDAGSVWKCGVDVYFSNSLTLEVLNPTTYKSPSGVLNVHVIVGSSAGLVIIIALFILVVVCFKHNAGKTSETGSTVVQAVPTSTAEYITATFDPSENIE